MTGIVRVINTLRHVIERIAEHPVNHVNALLPWHITGMHPRLNQRIAA